MPLPRRSTDGWVLTSPSMTTTYALATSVVWVGLLLAMAT